MSMEIYRGENISPGVAFGRAFVFQEIMHARYTRVTILPEKAVFEQKRVREAIDASIREIAALITKVNDDLGYDESTIFQVHRGILEDPSFFDEIVTLIGDELVNAETAVRAVVERWEQRFAAAPSPQFAMKAADLLDIGKRIMANLCYGGAVCPFRDDLSFPEMGQDVIFVARMLLPSVSAYIDPRRVRGIIAELGNKSSHSAVIAKSLGLPTVFGVEHALARITDGDEVIIDGSAGIVFVRPDDKIRKEYETFRADFTRYQSRIETLSELPAVTTDGVSVDLYANIGAFADTVGALRYHATGIGLYRTEMPFLIRNELPDEQQQYTLYRRVIEQMRGREVFIRTLDLGGDKVLNSLPMPAEQNPNLGWRAIRVFIDHPELFKVQLRAILRASVYGTVGIILPMISDLTEVLITKEILAEVVVELTRSGVPFSRDVRLGIMIEVPSAVILAEHLAAEVDFLSVGTNDLIQYTLAVDRNSEKVARYFEPLNPAIIIMLRSLVEVADKAGKPLTICGEVASEPLYVPLLVGLGFTRLSLNPLSLNIVKDVIRSISAAEARVLAQHILTLNRTTEIRSVLYEYFSRMKELYNLYFRHRDAGMA